MANTLTKNKIISFLNARAEMLRFLQFDMPQFAAALTGMTATYLCNGAGSVSLVSGGTGYTNSVFTLPSPPTAGAPTNSTPPVISCTNTLGVLSAPTIILPGSGMGIGNTTFVPTDPNGTGAVFTISPANTEQLYNWTIAEGLELQYYIGFDMTNMGPMLQGLVGGNTAGTVTIGSGGGSYSVGGYLYNAATGLLCQITAVSSGAVTALTIMQGGICTVTSGLATTNPGGSGTGCTLNVTAVAPYNWTANTLAWTKGAF
jgi:hypothetical protein